MSKVTGMVVQRNKAIVGQNAFAHEAGIHQHGMLQSRETYEIMRPADVGFIGENLVLGKHSGRHAFRDRLVTLGFDLDEAVFQKVFDDFIALADKKKQVYDSDLIALIDLRSLKTPATWKLVRFQTLGGTGTMPTATLEMEHADGHRVLGSALGDGPVDAVFKCLEQLTGKKGFQLFHAGEDIPKTKSG